MVRHVFLLLACQLAAQDGASLYKQHCANCHDAGVDRVPPLAALKAMPAMAIRGSLESGKMRQQGAGLSAVDRDRVAAFLGTAAKSEDPIAYCKDAPVWKSQSNWNGWSPGFTNNRLQPNPGWDAAQIPRLQLKWAFALGQGAIARGQPSVVDGKLFIGAQSGAVYAIHPATGCVHWTFQAAAQIRSGVVAGDGRVYFGDGKANVYAVDSASGKKAWTAKADEHPQALITGTVQLHKDVLYVPVASFEEGIGGQPKYPCCTFRGSLLALDARTGKTLWKAYTIADPPQPTAKNSVGTQLYGPSGAAVWSTPTIDESTGRIYIATGDNYSDPPTATSDSVIALNLKSGRVVWVKQLTANDVFTMGSNAKGPDHDLGQSPILVNLPNGKRALVIGQKSGVAHALDPDAAGKILWQTRVGDGGMLGGIQWGSAADASSMYVAVSDIGTARIAGRSSLDPKKGGGLFALQLTTGEKFWTAPPARCPENRVGCSPGHSAAVTVTPGAVFAGSLDGHIRAFATSNGQVIWDFDTAREFTATNGTTANGGSIDGPGPVIANGMLFTNSGYGVWGGIPGNVLLAFSIDGK